jgi:choloylglycine hydrolase
MCLQDDPASHSNLGIPAVLLLIATPLQPHVCEAGGHKSTVHLAIEDASGDSAVIEFVKGVQKIYHGK